MSGEILTRAEAGRFYEDGYTYADLVRLFIPDADDDLCDFLLWERTPYPICRDVDTLIDSLASELL